MVLGVNHFRLSFHFPFPLHISGLFFHHRSQLFFSFSMASDGDSDHEYPVNKDSTTISNKKNVSQDPILNSRNPFYLHPGENPDAVLVEPPLDDNNYHIWRKYMHCALISKKNLGFINGTLSKPLPSHQDFELWERSNNMILP